MEYVTEYRLSMATIILIITERTVSDIASSCGFSTLSCFCKVFREQCGVSPKKYRKQTCAKV
ncbi:helix-turn-helix transcriptional regulator [Saccharibacillus sacchari]|uniref:helix-turn-helix domain-containing protein n=1 Tax=Saccharibacillus sacchari TaxID=456493 RepID=UPI000A0565D0